MLSSKLVSLFIVLFFISSAFARGRYNTRNRSPRLQISTTTTQVKRDLGFAGDASMSTSTFRSNQLYNQPISPAARRSFSSFMRSNDIVYKINGYLPKNDKVFGIVYFGAYQASFTVKVEPNKVDLLLNRIESRNDFWRNIYKKYPFWAEVLDQKAQKELIDTIKDAATEEARIRFEAEVERQRKAREKRNSQIKKQQQNQSNQGTGPNLGDTRGEGSYDDLTRNNSRGGSNNYNLTIYWYAELMDMKDNNPNP